jgi:hypothetical protein
MVCSAAKNVSGKHIKEVGMDGAYRVLVRKLEGEDLLEDLVIDGRIILKCFLKKCDSTEWTGLKSG